MITLFNYQGSTFYSNVLGLGGAKWMVEAVVIGEVINSVAKEKRARPQAGA